MLWLSCRAQHISISDQALQFVDAHLDQEYHSWMFFLQLDDLRCNTVVDPNRAASRSTRQNIQYRSHLLLQRCELGAFAWHQRFLVMNQVLSSNCELSLCKLMPHRIPHNGCWCATWPVALL